MDNRGYFVPFKLREVLKRLIQDYQNIKLFVTFQPFNLFKSNQKKKV